MKIEVSQQIGAERKWEARVKNEEWMAHYDQYYEMLFANNTSHIKMDGFRKGAIPGILLELKYPFIVSETNEKSMFAIIQAVYADLKKDYPNIKLDHYKIDEETKDLIVLFHVKEEQKEGEQEQKQDEATEGKTTKAEGGKRKKDKTVKLAKKEKKEEITENFAKKKAKKVTNKEKKQI